MECQNIKFANKIIFSQNGMKYAETLRKIIYVGV